MIFLALEVLLAILCVWIVVPPPNHIALVATVAAIELSPYLLVINLVAMLFAWRSRVRLQVWVVAVGSFNVILCAIPIIAEAGVGTPFVQPPAQADPRAVDEFAIPVSLGGERTSIRAYLPETGAKNPIVFAIYGGGWQWGTPANDTTLNQTLASQGYAVFALDYRHAPAYRFPAPLEDVRSEMALIERRASDYRADPHRIAIIGHSSGGELAELSAFARPSAFRALVSYSGAVDLAMGYEVPPQPDPINVRSIIVSYMGDTPARVPGRYRAASPIDNVRCGAPPTLLLYGDRDHVVDFRSAVALRDALRRCGTDVTLIELPWAEHGFEDVAWGLHAPGALIAVEAFLRRTL